MEEIFECSQIPHFNETASHHLGRPQLETFRKRMLIHSIYNAFCGKQQFPSLKRRDELYLG